MSKRTRKSAATTSNDVVVEQNETIVEPTPVAVLVAPAPSTPESKRGKSSVQSPVAFVWANSHNLIEAAIAAGTAQPSRSALQKDAIAKGIAFYTARTQVQAYLKARAAGGGKPAKFPRGVQVA